VNQEDLQMFLAAAEELRIKGLSQVVGTRQLPDLNFPAVDFSSIPYLYKCHLRFPRTLFVVKRIFTLCPPSVSLSIPLCL
jgi:hypothetical protein